MDRQTSMFFFCLRRPTKLNTLLITEYVKRCVAHEHNDSTCTELHLETWEQHSRWHERGAKTTLHSVEFRRCNLLTSKAQLLITNLHTSAMWLWSLRSLRYGKSFVILLSCPMDQGESKQTRETLSFVQHDSSYLR